jgi:hypothetical protein
MKEIPMKTNKLMLYTVGLLMPFTVAAASAADAPKLKFTFTDVHANKTAKETDTYAVNNKGVIAGDYIDSAGVQHGMILDGKKLTTVDNKKNCEPSTIEFSGINDADTAAGYCFSVKTGLYEGFTYAKSTKKFAAISFPGSYATQADGINDQGDVTGGYTDTAGAEHGFVKKGKKYTRIDVKGATNTYAEGINNKEWIILNTTTTPGNCPCAGYLLKPGEKPMRIKDPKEGSKGNDLNGINNKGDIVGVYYDTNNHPVGLLALYHGGKYSYHNVKDPKADNSTRADGLNDKLEIVGRYGTAKNPNIGFKAIPKTE